MPSPVVAPTPATPAPATPTVGPTSGGPTANVELTGDKGMAGPVAFSGSTRGNGVGIRCHNPSFEGPGIQLFNASPVEGANVAVRIAPGEIGGSPLVMVTLSSGSGETYSQRDFVGPDVSEFDAARGAAFDTALVPTGTQTRPDELGTLTHISGSVDCASQTAGSTDLTLSGIGDGVPSGPIEQASVLCAERDAQRFVSVLGIVRTGTARFYVFVTVSDPGVQVVVRDEASSFTFYNGTGGSAATTSGGTADTDLTSEAGATIHVAGEATCGNLAG